MNGSAAREQRAWYVYDWANSAFYTTVVAVMLPPYLTALAKAASDDHGYVSVLGFSVLAQSVWPYTVALSVLLQVLVLPVCGAIADYGHRKREMLGTMAIIGSAATIAMFLLSGRRFLLGCLLFLVANVAFGASIVIYNSFLPEIAPPEQRDSVSARGWAIGYFGGGLLLALNLLLYLNAASFGLSDGAAVRISLASAGVWWLVFALVSIAGLRNRAPAKSTPEGQTALDAALGQLAHTFSSIRHYPQTLLFLAAYLIYNDAIQTVFAMASQFGAEELKMGMSDLTQAVLIVQFVAFGGAIAFNWLAGRIGAQKTVLVTLVIWCGTLILIYFWVHTKREFYIAAAVIATVMGGSQALSRSLFSLMIPKGQEAEYFSVYEISDKGTSWLGPLFFGLALSLTRSFRVAILSLILFFIVGLILLAKVDLRRAIAEAGNEAPPRL